MSTETTVEKPTVAEQSAVSTLEERIQSLNQLNDRIQQLRHVPSLLLRHTTTPDVLMFSDPASDLQHDLEVVKEVNEKLRSKDVQEILKAAAESEKKDSTGLQPRRGRRSEKSKPHDAPSPESPMAFPSFQPPSSQLLPSADLSAPLKLEGLADFIRDYNKSHNHRLYIWTSTSRQQATALHNFPVTVRFTIPDVVAIYLTLGCNPTDETIIVESATAFGPAERKPPHSQSDYAVYQKLSQQLAKVIQSQPLAPFQLILTVLASYENLFLERCSVCQRVLSVEGHIPAVGRIWTHKASGSENPWEARHPTCMHNS